MQPMAGRFYPKYKWVKNLIRRQACLISEWLNGLSFVHLLYVLVSFSTRGVKIHRKYGSPRYEAGGSVHGPFLVISVRFTQKNFFEWQN